MLGTSGTVMLLLLNFVGVTNAFMAASRDAMRTSTTTYCVRPWRIGRGGPICRNFAVPRISFFIQNSFISSNMRNRLVRDLYVHTASPLSEVEDLSSNRDQEIISQELVQDLDLLPLMENVAQFCSTKRGRDSLLRQVGVESCYRNGSVEDHSTFGYIMSKTNQHDARLLDSRRMTNNGIRFKGHINKKNCAQHLEMSYHESDEQRISHFRMVGIVKIAGTAEEARLEYSMVKEAYDIMLIDDDRQRQQTVTSSNEENNCISNEKLNGKDCDTILLPPIYGRRSKSPFDIVNDTPISDDDEWIGAALMGLTSAINYECILKVEQIVKMLLATYNWSQGDIIQQHSSQLASLGSSLDNDKLRHLCRILTDSIIIVHRGHHNGRNVRTTSNASLEDSSSLELDLNHKKFPALHALRDQEADMIITIENALKGCIKGVKDSDGKQIYATISEYDGRPVVLTHKKVANKIGRVCQTLGKSDCYCYVEPFIIKDLMNDFQSIRRKKFNVEEDIIRELAAAIATAAPSLQCGLNVVARIDVLFAKAAFGIAFNGEFPRVENEGCIAIDSFVHPVLALNGAKKSQVSIVPVRLDLDRNSSPYCLAITGPNGGGKTVALKCFGMCAMMVKLAIPVPIALEERKRGIYARCDFFAIVAALMGDRQSICEGQSTMMAKLSAYSKLMCSLQSTAPASSVDSKWVLLLLDELGSGSDPEGGSAIAQAVIETFLKKFRCRVVATTHSPHLKALSLDNREFKCASMLLKDDTANDVAYKVPSFRLVYGITGESYALGAILRCQPPFPEHVALRASALMSENSKNDAAVFNLQSRLEREVDAAANFTRHTEQLEKASRQHLRAASSLAKNYEAGLRRVENRLQELYITLLNDHGKSSYEIIGSSLADIRLVKNAVQSEAEILAEGGLRRLHFDEKISVGGSVVIIDGEYEGLMASVSETPHNITVSGVDEVSLTTSYSGILSDEAVFSGERKGQFIILKRNQIAVWDYPPNEGDDMSLRTTQRANARILDILSHLQPPTVQLTSQRGNKSTDTTTSQFISARDRKAGRKNKRRR